MLPIKKPHKFKLQHSTKDDRDIVYSVSSSAIIPDNVDLRSLMPPVLDQLSLGACAVNAGSNSLRYLLSKEKLTVFQPSRLYMYWNARVSIEHTAPSQDSGISLRDLCIALVKYHVCDETLWPYNVRKFWVQPSLASYNNANLHKQIQYVSIPQTLVALKQVLSQNYPVIFGVEVYSSFESDSTIVTGHIPIPNTSIEQLLGGHALLLCGYIEAEQSFIVQQSWGTGIGLNGTGFFTIPYAYVLDPKLAFDFWVFQYFG